MNDVAPTEIKLLNNPMLQLISRRKKAVFRGMQTLCAALLLVSAGEVRGQTPLNVMVSPAGGQLPGGVSQIGGLVIDLVGINGVRVVGEVSPAYLFQGWATNVDTAIGTASGFNLSLLGAMGGGLSKAAFRITLYDGDNALGDFDYNQNFLVGNGITLGNFSSVQTVQTDYTGKTVLSTNLAGGFRASTLDTGFFQLTDTTSLRNLYASMRTAGTIDFVFNDK